MLNTQQIIALRMERQYLTHKVTTVEYDALYRDVQPGQDRKSVV